MTVGDGRPLQQPVERDLRHGLAGLAGDLVERVDHLVEVLVGDRRAVSRQFCCRRLTSGSGWPRRILPVSRPQPSGLQTTVPDALVEAERHQLPFVVAADQRVVGLVRDVARPAVSFGDRRATSSGASRRSSSSRCSGSCRAARGVERRERLFDRRHGVEAVQLVEVDVVGAEPAQAGFDRRGSDDSATSRRRSGRRPCGRWPWWR